MSSGTSSALDQPVVPVYRGPQARANAKDTVEEPIAETHNGRSSTEEKRKREADSPYPDQDRSRLTKSKGRRSSPWYQSRDLQIATLITILAAVVRLWALGYPTSVVFDEVHFGGFASKYISGRFFMDVHPPLAKMLIALMGWLFGLDPSFTFKEIGVIVTQSRLILLDSPLIFFTAFTVLAWVNFHNQRHEAFSDDWFIWLFLTGAGLGLSLSVKWVGLFVIATIGMSTLNQLWSLWGDLRVSPRVWLNHFLARAVCLIVVPIAVYMLMFEIHFLLLESSGDGDGFMSAPFQMTLGHSLQDSPLSVAYGATVTIRHQGTQGGYLHSHPSNYETGSKQQQITLYPHKDSNNDWIIQKRDGTVPESLEYVKNGDYVRLVHAQTHKRLHSHDHKAPVTESESHFEVSAYGYEGFAGDANDDWRLEIVEFDGSNSTAGEQLHTLRSKFKLVHPNMSCDLFSHKVKLPKWAFEQQEVACMRSAVVSKTTWIIESNRHDAYPSDAPMVNYKKPGFLGKFLELNKVMWTTNAGLTDSHPYDSRPSSWPLLKRGISFWGKDQKHIYLVGNWFTWYASSVAIVLYAVIRGLLFLRDKRGYRDDFRGLREYYEMSGGFFFMAWGFHYLPFFLMGRQLFLHHYLPALYFAILLFSVTFDVASRFVPNKFRLIAVVLIVSTAVMVFRTRAPLTYGLQWTRSECEASKLLRTWDYDCNQYPVEYSHYVTTTPVPPQAKEEKLDPVGSEVDTSSQVASAAAAVGAEIPGVDVGKDTAVVDNVQEVSDINDPLVTDPASATVKEVRDEDDESEDEDEEEEEEEEEEEGDEEEEDEEEDEK
ncbi:hypothetical protein BGZ80_004758 [Entomortierella chlamydospora]|uniref:Dolichyl-phosphate-mannose--protein mannosyltransferase n=1 Tax=Entomortierella chlamydospora TaxID=101097 RepID=A0A9P6SVW0_9FUNG|nr:hypothetical protein BGZ80_004758 [Entomortierella chlamydospora]